MKQIELRRYFPTGGKSSETIEITDIKHGHDIITGRAKLPLTEAEQKVIIYQLQLDNGNVDMRVIPAACPHQGYDLSDDRLKADGNVYCSWHRRPICVYSEHNLAFSVEQQGDKFFILPS